MYKKNAWILKVNKKLFLKNIFFKDMTDLSVSIVYIESFYDNDDIFLL